MIETKRLVLRRLKTSDLAALTGLLGDVEVMEFSDRGALDENEAKAWLTGQITSYERSSELGILGVVKKSDSELIGYCGLTEIPYIGVVPDIEVGYRLVRKAWGHGYATEAACAVRDYAFSELKIDRLISLIEPGNKRSIRVAEKLGMSYEKEVLLESYDYPDRLYSMSAPEKSD